MLSGLPLVLCFYLLRTLRNTSADDEVLTELLVEELVADRPRFLPAPDPVPVIAEEPPSAPGIEHDPADNDSIDHDSPAPAV